LWLSIRGPILKNCLMLQLLKCPGYTIVVTIAALVDDTKVCYKSKRQKCSKSFVPDSENRVVVGLLSTVSIVTCPIMVVEALHGSLKLPVAVHVKLNQPSRNVVVLAVDTTTPSPLVHV